MAGGEEEEELLVLGRINILHLRRVATATGFSKENIRD